MKITKKREFVNKIAILYSEELLGYFKKHCKGMGVFKTPEDLLQDLYERLLKAKNLDINNLKIMPYLFTSAKNLLIDRSRRNAFLLEKNSIGFDDFTDEFESDNSEILNVMIAQENLKEVVEFVYTMNKKCVRCFLLKQLRGMTNKQIAETMDITVSMVEKHTFALNNALREAGYTLNQQNRPNRKD